DWTAPARLGFFPELQCLLGASLSFLFGVTLGLITPSPLLGKIEIVRALLGVCKSLRAAVIAVIDGEFRCEEIDGQNLAVPLLRRATVRRAERTYRHCTTELAVCYLVDGAPRDVHPRPRSAALAICCAALTQTSAAGSCGNADPKPISILVPAWSA